MTKLIEGRLDVRAIIANLASSLTNLAGPFVRESLSHLITVLLTFYLLYYFLRDRRAAKDQIKICSPLTEYETGRLIERAIPFTRSSSARSWRRRRREHWAR
jgi:predicted PurR-regulated permease PerM